jgi:hypothetical protein
MTKKKKVDVVCIVDKSGSMARLTDETILGFNKFLQEQQELPGKANFTLALFNHEYFLIHNKVPIKKARELDRATYYADGWTALLDAVGKTVASVRAAQKKDRPTIVAVFTDGHENASKEYTKEGVKAMVEELQGDHGWQFPFIGAGLDNFDDAAGMGFDARNFVAVAASDEGIAQAYSSYTASTRALREQETE